MHATRASNPQVKKVSGDVTKEKRSIKKQAFGWDCSFDEEIPSSSDPSRKIPKHFFDLSDDVIVNILTTLSEEDACRAAKVSWRLHMLLLLHTPGSQSHTRLRIDSRVTSEHARDLVRKTPQLKSLELRYRADADMLLGETARNCPELQTLTLIGCRGDVGTTPVLRRLPLLELATKCTQLRVLYLHSTKVRSLAAIKTWCNNRGPGSPTLIVRIDGFTPKQIEQIQRLQEKPSPKCDFSIRPCVFTISKHKLNLCLESPPSPSPPTIDVTSQPSKDTESTLTDTAEESGSFQVEQAPSSITESWFTCGFIGNVNESPAPTSHYLDPTSYSPTDLQTQATFR